MWAKDGGMVSIGYETYMDATIEPGQIETVRAEYKVSTPVKESCTISKNISGYNLKHVVFIHYADGLNVSPRLYVIPD